MKLSDIAKEILSQSYNVTDQAGEELHVVDTQDVMDILNRLASNGGLAEEHSVKNQCDEKIVYKLFKNNNHVGFEIHQPNSHFKDQKYGIFHSTPDGVEWDVINWPARFINHDRKELVWND